MSVMCWDTCTSRILAVILMLCIFCDVSGFNTRLRYASHFLSHKDKVTAASLDVGSYGAKRSGSLLQSRPEVISTRKAHQLQKLTQNWADGGLAFASGPGLSAMKIFTGTNKSISSRKQRRSTEMKKKTLTILGLFELTYFNGSRRSSGERERAAAQLALDDINQNEEILPEYQLRMLTNDTQCDPGAGVDAFFHALYTEKSNKIISLLGTSCSEVTERLAKVTTHQGIVQVSFGSTSPALSDRKEFPLFYRTVSPVASHSEAIIQLIKHFDWDTVTFFTKNENNFAMPVNHLAKRLEEENVTCKATLTFSMSDFRDQLQEMKELDSRIIIASFGTDVAPLIFCEVYRKEMWGRDYAWILIGTSETEWWKSTLLRKSLKLKRQLIRKNAAGKDARNYRSWKFRHKTSLPKPDCTSKELSAAVENVLVVDRYSSLIGVSDFSLTTEAFRERLQRMTPVVADGTESRVLGSHAAESYDGIFTIALGLDRLRQKYNYSLEDFDYMNDSFSQTLNEEIGQLTFTGISGPLEFSGSDRIGITSFSQIQGGVLRQVGLFHPQHSPPEAKLELSTCVQCRSVQWPGNQVPIARRWLRIKLIRVKGSFYIFVVSMALLGILLATTFLAFNLYYRKLKYIKLSSPKLNNMVVIGCIFAYIAVIILGSNFEAVLSTTTERQISFICTIRAYLLSTAFSLAFGAMFAKTYRVHRIFTRSCIGVVKNKLLKDTQLMTLVMALLFIDVVIVSSWAFVDPMHRHLRNLTIQIDPLDRSVIYQPQIEVCRSQHGHVWLSVMYGYKSLLLVVGIYMAWETRHVKIQALNDSKNIAYCVYIVVLTSILAVSLANLISDRVTLAFVTVTALILTSTTVTLCLLFLPKIHAIKTGRHKGDPVTESMGLKIEFNTRRLVAEAEDARELLFRAEVQNRVYKRQIEAIDVEIWRLENLLLCSSNSSAVSVDHQPAKTQSQEGVNGDQGVASGNSSEDNSEIYTVYLQGPRFIVPISVLNFQNPNALLPNLLKPESNLERSQPPRSSWPNIRSFLTPYNGLVSKKYTFKSEPKLVVEKAPGEELEPHTCPIDATHDVQPFDLNVIPDNICRIPSPRVTFEGSDENFSHASASTAKSSRKDSNTSCNENPRGKRASIVSLLKHPFTYLSNMIRRSSDKGKNNDQGPEDSSSFHLKVPQSSVRYKFNSAPDLWAVRSSPVMHQHNKKSSILSDSVVDTSAGCIRNYLSQEKSTSNPQLKLTVTSAESAVL